jgi:hypothetical protein
MKAELNTKEAADVEHTFPALYQAIRADGSIVEKLIVLAIDSTTACRLGHDGSYLYEGHGDWVEFTDPKEWRRLPAGTTITLTQE